MVFGQWCADGEACGVCPWCKKRRVAAFRLCVALFIFVASFILLLHVSHAAIINQEIDTYLDGISEYLVQDIGTSTQSGTVSGLTVKASAWSNSPTLTLQITTSSFMGSPAYFINATATQPANDPDGSATDFVTFSFDQFTFDSQWDYCFRLTQGGGSNWWRGSNVSTAYLTANENADASNCSLSSPFGTVKDAYFVWTEAEAPPTVEIVYPENSAAIFDPNFNWIIEASTSTGSIGVFYGTSSTTPEYFDGYFSVINGTSSYPKGTPLFNGTYYAWVALYAATEAGEQIATSSVISFQIGFGGGSSGGGTSGDWSLSTSTLCADIQPFATATYIGQFSNAVLDGSCKALVFAFFPSTSSVQEIVDIKDLVFDKPPIGYFSAISDAIDLSTTTAAFSFPTTTVAALQTAVIDPFDTYFPLVVGLTTGIWIFKRFANKDKL